MPCRIPFFVVTPRLCAKCDHNKDMKMKSIINTDAPKIRFRDDFSGDEKRIM